MNDWNPSMLDSLIPEDQQPEEPTFITPDGIPVPLSKALEAVDRCVVAIRIADHYLALLSHAEADEKSGQPFREIRTVLIGEGEPAAADSD